VAGTAFQTKSGHALRDAVEIICLEKGRPSGTPVETFFVLTQKMNFNAN
jgi:hypothetical protein